MPDADDLKATALALSAAILAVGLTAVIRVADEPTTPWALCVAGVIAAAAAPLVASRLLVDQGALRVGSWLRSLQIDPNTIEAITREAAERSVPALLQTPGIYTIPLALFVSAGVAKAMR